MSLDTLVASQSAGQNSSFVDLTPLQLTMIRGRQLGFDVPEDMEALPDFPGKTGKSAVLAIPIPLSTVGPF
jgi:hypothetical protein